VLAVACLVVQAAALAAFVPRNCCAAHDHAGPGAERSCHEPPAAKACPMQAEDGASCPMHRPAAAPQDDARGCVMRGTCDGPPLFTLLAQPGVLEAPAPRLAADPGVWLVPPARDPLTSLAVPPDAPPPRS
jgi:hypothetical protein